MPTTPTAPAALPAAPDPNDRSTFNSRAYPWSAALPGFATDLVAVATNAYANATEAAAAAVTATVQAAAAQAAVGAVVWVSGTTYAYGTVVWSTTNGRVYRRKVAGAGTTDPSADPTNWWEISVQPAVPLVDVSTNTSATVGVVYRLTATLTLTLPSTPAVGDWVAFVNNSSVETCVVARNGKKIMGLSEDMTLNNVFASGRLVFSGDTTGWVFA